MMPNIDPPLSSVGLSIWRIVKEQPGIHFRGLGRAANLSSVGQLRHHLDRLARRGILLEVEDGRYKRFFVAGDHHPDLRPGLARFARRVPRLIGTLLLARPMNRAELRRTLGCADSTLGYHLTRMLLLGDLVRTRTRNRTEYALADPEFVRKVLVMQPGGVMTAPGRSGHAHTTIQGTPPVAVAVAEAAAPADAVVADSPQPAPAWQPDERDPEGAQAA